MLPLGLPVLNYFAEEYGVLVVVLSCIAIAIGCVLCATTKINYEFETFDQKTDEYPLIRGYFKMIKWVLIAALVFHIIAACFILFFYWLNKEFEATLVITLITGIVIGFIIEVAIPYYKNYKPKD